MYQYNSFEEAFYRLGEAFEVRCLEAVFKGAGLEWHLKREATGELLYDEAPEKVEFDATREALEIAEELFLDNVEIDEDTKTFTAVFTCWGGTHCYGKVLDVFDVSKYKLYKGKCGDFIGIAHPAHNS